MTRHTATAKIQNPESRVRPSLDPAYTPPSLQQNPESRTRRPPDAPRVCTQNPERRKTEFKIRTGSVGRSVEGKQNPESRIQSPASLGPRKQERIQNSEFEVVLGRVRLGEDTIQNPESEMLPREQRAKTKYRIQSSRHHLRESGRENDKTEYKIQTRQGEVKIHNEECDENPTGFQNC